MPHLSLTVAVSGAVPGHARSHLDVSRRLGIAPLQSTGSSWTEMCGRYNLISNLTVLGDLNHHVHILEMNGQSYRLKQSRQATTLRSAGSPADP